MGTDIQPKVDSNPLLIQHTLKSLLEESMTDACYCRDTRREPFFAPIEIIVESNGDQHHYSALTREISPKGIGLLHNMMLEDGEVTLVIYLKSGRVIRLLSKVMWCKSCGEGWYLSGAEILGVVQG